MTIRTHIPGFPRIGPRRELKFALEQYWKGGITLDQLEQTGRELRTLHWSLQRAAGLDWVSVGDFAFYDHVASHIQLLGCEPKRFGFSQEIPELDRYFAMARGVTPESSPNHACHPCHAGQVSAVVADQSALGMKKWFDTNYHSLVPEFSSETRFSLNSTRLFDEIAEAQALGHPAKATLIGPLTFLWLGKAKNRSGLTDDSHAEEFDRLSLLDDLLPVYGQILGRLKEMNVEWAQIDEPILGLDLPHAWRNAFERAYWQLNQHGVQVLLATYFSPLEENLSAACKLPVAGLHVDAVRAPQELASIADWLPAHKILSVGAVDGRNVWRSDLDAVIRRLLPLLDKRKGDVWLSTSCSLLHVPYSLEPEDALDDELKSWMAFASEKLTELSVLKQALEGTEEFSQSTLDASRLALDSRRASTRVHDPAVSRRLQELSADADRRHSPFSRRQALQRNRLGLPAYPTTTIGSFPQTESIRSSRAAFRGGRIDHEAYRHAMRSEIAATIAKQEAIGLDVLVHGEAERSDMVEYFGEQLGGFAFTRFGWVQSYGSRCVKPPLIVGDVSRPYPMTVDWTTYAQSLTSKPMKGMLTGPITLLQWSFVRDDQPRETTALQIALAVRDEVTDLERAGTAIIQIDEPAIREGLPLRRSHQDSYLAWATRAFRVAASPVHDATQIHTHMCYSEFRDILPWIAAMDADVVTIETSRSDMELLKAFGDYRYPNEIGPGVYDIHSPAIPSVAQMVRLLRKAIQVVPGEHVWVNPDCGLKTRGWRETEAALRNMVTAARQLRAESCSADTVEASVQQA